MKRYSKWAALAGFLLLLIYPVAKTYQTHKHHPPVFGLLIPDGAEGSLSAKLWMKAAEEEGVPLEPLTYENFTNPFQIGIPQPKGILIPDEVSENASATLVSFLQEYVKQGGKLILVGDALMHGLNGRLNESFPAEVYFQFPKILGRVGDTIQLKQDTLRITDEWKEKLQIPPGQYSPLDTVNAPFREFCTYQSLHALYPHYPTDSSAFSGQKILEAGDGSLVAGIQKLGEGETLWINLPLSYLKRRTDGLLMHSFLRWISEDWLSLPRLLSVPNGVGGVVLNVHVDSNAALPYLTKLKELDFFSHGPFSIHVTAGPDTREFRDGLGFNLLGSHKSQDWIKYWIQKGHNVGSHGGWIHDFFGLHIGEKQTPEFVKYLEENFEAVKKISGVSPVEYSAPLGNQPIWVNNWLRKKGYRSYYFVGDNGMGPTQNFRDGDFTDKDLWSFPIASFQRVASFEEAEDQKVPKKEMTAWLSALTDFVSTHHAARLFYFHPPGIRFYQESLLTWMKQNEELAKLNHFKWYTMDRLAQFLTNRSELSWNLRSLKPEHQFELNVHAHPGLREMVWRVPKDAVKQMKVVTGKVKIQESGNEIQVQSENDKGFSLQYEEVQHGL